MKTQGYVTYVGNKPNKFGKLFHSFKVDSMDKFIGAGSVDPNLSRNDRIEFEYEENRGFINLVQGSIRHLPSDSGNSTDKPTSSGGKSDYQLKEQYWRGKEERDIKNEGYRRANDLRIQYQSARNAAIEVTKLLVENSALIIPEKKGAGVEVIMAKIEDLTGQFFSATGEVGEDKETETIEKDKEEVQWE